ncbi:MAG: hypothetical protein KGL39_26375 [Patescibacteria group bacterium]|nr:hypothetical protein [Patescibacteria group bacterium]
MKTLTNAKCEVKDGKLTFTADISEGTVNEMLITRVCHEYVPKSDYQHRYRIMSSSEAVFVESKGSRVFYPNEMMVRLAYMIEPKISHAPIFRDSNNKFSASIDSELPMTVQWQECDNPYPIADKQNTPPPPAQWNNIDGENSTALTQSKTNSGKWYRCVAVNAAGATISKPFKV